LAKITYGERIGKQGKLGVGCSASVVDPENHKVLLIQRADNGRWAVPGGYMEAGESVTEACEREVWEETGLRVNVIRLAAVYSDPNILLEYADGNKWQLVVLHFVAQAASGELGLSDETTNVGFFSLEEAANLDISPFDRQRIADGLANQEAAFIRDNIRF
jgi:ADP-ribose pyrophosphatase YjhB (NUDIX family)